MVGMQRRAAAVYVAFFLVLGAASYSLVATAEEPTLAFENPDHRLGVNESFQVAGSDETYTVGSIDAEVEGGDHGGATTVTRSGTVNWVNESARYTESWENNSTVTVDETDWTVQIPNETDPDGFTLQEDLNETAILEADPAVDNETVTRDGTRYVVRTENDSITLVPASEYFPAPTTRTFDEGGTLAYAGNQTTVENVSSTAVRLAWTGQQTNTVEVSDRANVTVGGQTYLAFFPDNSTLVLTQDFESYERQTSEIARYHEHVSGLWGVTIVSGMTAVLLIGLAYLPSRY